MISEQRCRPSVETAAQAGVWLRLLADAKLARALHVVATVGVADHLIDGPQRAEPLARRTGCDPGMLGRLLRYLTFAGVFTAEDGRYGLNQVSRLLRSDVADSLREMLSIGTDDRALWWSTGELMYSVRTGRPAFDHVYGQSLWEAMQAGGPSSSNFQRSMSAGSKVLADGLARAYDWSSVDMVADLGGGAGSVLTRLLSAHPRLRGTLVDRPSVTAEAAGQLAEAGVAARCAIVAGDLFEAVPEGADRYLLMRVLHDWSDEDATTILRNCRNACGPHSRLLVVDVEIGPYDTFGDGLAADIQMMLLAGGRERTEAELAGLLHDGGFRVTGRVELGPPYVAVEAMPGQDVRLAG